MKPWTKGAIYKLRLALFCTSKIGIIQESHGVNSRCESLYFPHSFTLLFLTSVSKQRIIHILVEVILSIKKSRATSGHIKNWNLVLSFLSIGYYFLGNREVHIPWFYVVLLYFILPSQESSPCVPSPGYASFLSSYSHAKIKN